MAAPVFGVKPATGQPVSERFTQDKKKRFISLLQKKMFQSVLLHFRFLFWTLNVSGYILYILFTFEFNSIKCKLLNR